MNKAFLFIMVFAFSPLTLMAAGDGEEKAMREITVLTEVENYVKGLEALMPEFTEATGAGVTIETLSQMSVQQKVIVELASGSSAYDLLFLEGDYVPRLVEGDFLEPLDDYLNNPELNRFPIDSEDFIQSTLDAFKYKGRQYALPFKAATQILYWRADILREYGLQGPPEDYEELRRMVSQVHTEEIPGIAMRGMAGTHNMWVWSQFLYGYGGRIFKDFPRDMTPIINSPEAEAALDIYVDMMRNYSIPGAASAEYNDVTIAMQQGRTVFAIEGAPLAARILDPEKSKVIGKLGFSVTPPGPEAQLPPFTAQGYGINKASRNKELAYLFAAWSTSASTLKNVALNDKYVSVTRYSVWNDPDFIEKYDYDYGSGSFTEAYRDTLAAAPSWYRPAFKDWGEVRDRIGLAVQEAVVGEKSSARALEDANADIADLLRERGYTINTIR